MMFLCVPTPMLPDGAADLSIVEEVVAECRDILPAGCLVVNKSTMPVGTAERMRRLLGRDDITVVSNPEFLREGSAVQDFLHPDRIVVGCDQEDAARRVAGLYAGVDAPLLLTDASSAELIKYAANCFLAVRLSYVNVLDELCERLGASIADVTKGIGYDHRIGHGSLSPGPGWGGACLPKDSHELLHMATGAGVPFDLLRSAIETNSWRQRQFVDRVRLAVTGDRAGSLRGKRVGLLGLTFKADTDDLRGSPALAVAALLEQAGAEILGYDPMVCAGTLGLGAITVVADPYAVAEDADAVMLLTDWAQIRSLDWARIVAAMRAPVIIDTRHAVDPDQITQAT
jgi:UDPglucose 6-dehydrogenase